MHIRANRKASSSTKRDEASRRSYTCRGITLALALSLNGAACLGAQSLSTAGKASAPLAVTESLPIQSGDTLSLKVLDVPELDQTNLRVTDNGDVPLLLLGSVHVAGLTPAQASASIAAAYTDRSFLRNAHVAVSVDNYSLSDVTVFGYVIGATSTAGTAGITVPIATPTPLLTVLARAGGFSDRASRTVTIQRRDRSIPPFNVDLPNEPTLARIDRTMIYPGDTLIVPRAGTVYILGHVNRSSGVLMTQDGTLSLMQALSQAGSPLPAASSKLRIFRKSDGQYSQLNVDLDKIEKGKQEDIQLQDADVIWVPFSYAKNLLVNGAQITAALASATATGIIYTR